jgi:hypothetical protein
MFPKLTRGFIVNLLFLFLVSSVAAQQPCFTSEERALAERKAKVWQEPDPDYDPVLGFNPKNGPRLGAPEVDSAGLAAPFKCIANKKPNKGSGTTPKFHCSVPGIVDFKGQAREKRNGEVYGEFLSSRFSKALGFFADDEWVADVTCPDCEKSLTSGFQGARFTPFQPAAGIELPLGKGIDLDCNDEDSGSIADSLSKLLQGGAPRAEIDAYKLWLAFIDHGDTKVDNQKFSCLKWTKNDNNTLTCEPGQAVFYVSDMGSTWGYSSSSEKKATLKGWSGKDPIRVSGGRCTTTAKSVGEASIGEAGRKLLADGLQRLLDAEKSNNLITRIFRASRNHERDQPAEQWTAEFERKAKLIINARCAT